MSSLPGFEAMKSSPNGQMVRVHAADGSVIVSLGPSFGKWLSYNQIPQVMVDAMVSTEDKRYYMHPGVDPIGMTRAAWLAVENRGSGRRMQGASTITQQDRKSVVQGKSVSVSVDLGGRRIMKKNTNEALNQYYTYVVDISINRQ